MGIPRLNTITDTLGRVTSFYYDANNLLSFIVGPDLSGSTRVLARFSYRSETLAPAFRNDVVVNLPTNPVWLMKAIYFPATNTGYWFGDTAPSSYSAYGMLVKVEQQRAMAINPDGTIARGTMTYSQLYNYPLSGDPNLVRAPGFTQMTEAWEGMTGTRPPTQYFVDLPEYLWRVETTNPDGTKLVQLRCTPDHAFACQYSLIYQEEFYSSAQVLLRKTVTDWQLDPVQNMPVRNAVTTYDMQSGETRTLLYGNTWHNNQPNFVATIQGEAGGTELRRVRLTYETSVNYDKDHSHILNLVKKVEVIPGGATNPIAVTDYVYDTPAAREQCIPGVNRLDVGQYRGNLTQVTRYPDPSNPASGIAENRTYDLNGNVVSVSWPVQTQVTYTHDTLCAYPSSQSRGDGTPNATVTTSAEYDVSTGLATATIDANGQRTTLFYYAGSLRLATLEVPAGGMTSFAYDDGALTVTKTEWAAGIAGRVTQYFTGIGQTTREEVMAPTRPGCTTGCLDVVEMQYYSNTGRLSQRSQPFSESTPHGQLWTNYTYDDLGRTTRIDAPAPAPDRSVTQMFYNESPRPSGASSAMGHTLRVQDTWNRSRWSLTDILGRLVEVAEPNPSGDGTLTSGALFTDHSYDSLDRLVEVRQGPQRRRFQYDGMGRLTQQKLAEKLGPLDASGNWVGGNSNWSDVFTYDIRSNLTSRKDARGIKTVFSYNRLDGSLDPLNRLQSTHFDTSGFQDLANPFVPVGDIVYQYRAAPKDVTQLLQLSFGATSDFPGGQESYGYDSFDRLQTKTQVFNGLAAYPQTITFGYDSLNRISDSTYPSQYGLPSDPRRAIHRDFDVEGRISGLQVDTIEYASAITYNNASQLSSVNIGPSGPLQIAENYTYEPSNGLLTRQTVQRGSTFLLDLGYDYFRHPTSVGTTGQLIHLINNLNTSGNVNYSYDAMGRLLQSGNAPTWSQTYSYDNYGNRTSVTTSGAAAEDVSTLTYDVPSNRLFCTTDPSVVKERFRYDAAGRLAAVYNDAGQLLETYGYGASGKRLMTNSYVTGIKKYQVWNGDAVIADYVEQLVGPTALIKWGRSYIHMGGRRLSTLTLDATGSNYSVEFHHPDRLGTRLISHAEISDVQEKWTLPFGTGATCAAGDTECFTSYERSKAVGLDYAENRSYHFSHGRFIQPDPIGMMAVRLGDPQSLNLYAYAGNDPTNRADPTGLDEEEGGEFEGGMGGDPRRENEGSGGGLEGWVYGRRETFAPGDLVLNSDLLNPRRPDKYEFGEEITVTGPRRCPAGPGGDLGGGWGFGFTWSAAAEAGYGPGAAGISAQNTWGSGIFKDLSTGMFEGWSASGFQSYAVAGNLFNYSGGGPAQTSPPDVVGIYGGVSKAGFFISNAQSGYQLGIADTTRTLNLPMISIQLSTGGGIFQLAASFGPGAVFSYSKVTTSTDVRYGGGCR